MTSWAKFHLVVCRNILFQHPKSKTSTYPKIASVKYFLKVITVLVKR